jgi:hypothetical protein
LEEGTEDRGGTLDVARDIKIYDEAACRCVGLKVDVFEVNDVDEG